MNSFDPIYSGNSKISPFLNEPSTQSKAVDLTSAREAPIKAIDDALERHAEIGIFGNTTNNQHIDKEGKLYFKSAQSFWNRLEQALAAKVSDEKSPIAKHEWGEVVVLVGNSSVGKTSIIDELIRQKPGMIQHGIDFAWTNVPLNYLNKFHPSDMAFLRTTIAPTKDEINNPGYLLNYIDPPGGKKSTLNFKKGITFNEKKQCEAVLERLLKSLYKALPGQNSEEYAHSIVTRMMDEVIFESKQGRPVALDILQIHEVALKRLEKEIPSVKIALVYVPFQTLAERVITRNNEAAKGDAGNAHLGVFPLEQFTKLFRPRNHTDLENDTVQTLTFSEAQHAIDTLIENSIDFLRLHNPESVSFSKRR